MTDLQRSIYRETLQRSRKTILEVPAVDSEPAPSKLLKKSKPALRQKEKAYSENSSNVLMDLRKAASHPMLFRTKFTDETLTGITKQLLKEPDFKRRGAIFDLVKEDMSVMTDSELQVFCASYKVCILPFVFPLRLFIINLQSTQKYLQEQECYVDAGKVQALLGLLVDYTQQGRKVLIFSQVSTTS